MQRNNYIKHKTAFNVLVYILWFLYIGTLLLATFKLLTGIAMHSIHVLEAITNHLPLYNVVTPTELILYIIFSVTIPILWIKVFNAFTQLIKIIRATNQFIKNHTAVYSSELNVYVIKTNRLLVFTSGIIKFKIFISTGTIKSLNKEELDVVILHELHHVRSFDPLKNIINNFVESSTPWFPLKKQLFQNYSTITELSADKYASESMNSEDSLLKALNKLLDISNPTAFSIATFISKLERIPILTGNTMFSFRSNYLLLVISIGIVSYLGVSLHSFNPIAKCDDFNQCATSLFTSNKELKSDTGMSCISN